MKISEACNAAMDEYLAILEQHQTLVATKAHPSQVGKSFATVRDAYLRAWFLYVMQRDAHRRRN